MHVTIPYKPREQQELIHKLWEQHRFGVAVCHRRMGKTVGFVNDLVKYCVTPPRSAFRAAYVGPTYTQAKAIAWDMVKKFTRSIPRNYISINESELRVDFLHSGARLRLFGADNPDSLRGLYLDRVVLDEFDLMKMAIWSEVLRPALADRKGSAVMVGTFKYIDGPLGQMYDLAEANPDWFSVLFSADETGVLDDDELEAARQSMSKEEYEREFLCLRNSAVRGSIFGRLVDEADAEGRIHPHIDYDPMLPVHTAWDLGMRDAMAVWFCQQVANEIRLIDYEETEGEGLHHWAQLLQEKGYVYGQHYGPHDIQVRELGTGKSRFEVAASLGIHFTVLPQIAGMKRNYREERIEMGRLLLPRCHFSRDTCQQGINALRSWRREENATTGALREEPVHDWSSHGSDSFTHLAQGLTHAGGVTRPKVDTAWVT